MTAALHLIEGTADGLGFRHEESLAQQAGHTVIREQHALAHGKQQVFAGKDAHDVFHRALIHREPGMAVLCVQGQKLVKPHILVDHYEFRPGRHYFTHLPIAEAEHLLQERRFVLLHDARLGAHGYE